MFTSLICSIYRSFHHICCHIIPYLQDVNMNNFYSHWQVSEGKSSDVETCRLLKLLHGVDVNVVIKFLPAFLNTMFQVLIQVNNEDVAENVVRYLILS